MKITDQTIREHLIFSIARAQLADEMCDALNDIRDFITRTVEGTEDPDASDVLMMVLTLVQKLSQMHKETVGVLKAEVVDQKTLISKEFPDLDFSHFALKTTFIGDYTKAPEPVQLEMVLRGEAEMTADAVH